MATTNLSVTARSAAVDAVVDLIDAASTGKMLIYSGSMPSSPETEATGTLLAELTFSNPAFGSAAVGAATSEVITGDAAANDTGTAGWARITDGNDNPIMDVDVGATGSGATIEFDSVEFEVGGAINITLLTFTVPYTYTYVPA